MTREEARRRLGGILTEATEFENSVCYVTEEDREPLEMAIKALEQEFCEDTISRKAAICCFFDENGYWYDPLKVRNNIRELPPVTPKPKTGHWIKSRDCYGNHHFTCSECGNDIATQYADNLNDKYCSECGAKMVEPQKGAIRNDT